MTTRDDTEMSLTRRWSATRRPRAARAAYADAMTELDTRPVGDPQLDDGEDNRFSHYVRKEDILRSAVDGVPVTALCGKKWLPGRDPEKYPVCPQCKEMMGMLQAMD